MYSTFSSTHLAFLAFALSSAILAVATPVPAEDAVGNGSSGVCGTQTLQCCLGLMPANSTATTTLLDALGVASPVEALVGIACKVGSSGSAPW